MYLCFRLLRHPTDGSQSSFYRQVLVHPGKSLVFLDLGICNHHSSSQLIPFLSSLFPRNMQHTWLQDGFYKFSSDVFLFGSFAHLFILL